jgi:flagellar assembly factor FliW
MKFQTSRFGTIETDPSEIIEFSDGLLGFDLFKRYVILNTQENSPFRWLQSLDEGSLAFIIIEPLQFMFAYDLEISDADVKALDIQNPEEVILYSIVTIPDKAQEMTANLQGPVVINAKNRKGRQVISTNPNHLVKTRVIDEMAKREAELKKVKDSLDSDKKEDKG